MGKNTVMKLYYDLVTHLETL
jgi:hypothetical protein